MNKSFRKSTTKAANATAQLHCTKQNYDLVSPRQKDRHVIVKNKRQSISALENDD